MLRQLPYGDQSLLSIDPPAEAELVDFSTPQGRPLEDPAAARAGRSGYWDFLPEPLDASSVLRVDARDDFVPAGPSRVAADESDEEMRPAIKPPAPMRTSAAKVVRDVGFMILRELWSMYHTVAKHGDLAGFSRKNSSGEENQIHWARRMPRSSIRIARFFSKAPMVCLKVRLLTPSSSWISAAEL